MKDLFKQRWFWITVLFATINIIGLVSIVNAIDGRGWSRFSSFFQNIAARMSFVGQGARKAGLEVGAAIKSSMDVLEVKGIEPSVSGTDMEIVVKLNNDPGDMNTKGFIEITPPVKFFVETGWNELRIKGDFKPRQTYRVEVLAGLKAEDGAVLKEAVTQDVVMLDYDPTVRFKVPGMYLGLKGNRLVPFEAINVGNKVEVTLQRLYDSNVVYFINKKIDAEDSYWRRDSLLDDIGTETITREVPVKVDINIPKEVVLDLKSMFPDSQQGLFQLRVTDPADSSVTDDKIVLVTDIGILLKKTPGEMLIWSASLKDATPVADAVVKVFSRKNLLIAEGRTDENGLMHFKDLDLTKDREPFAVTVVKDNDLSFLEVGSNTISETDFDIQGRPYLSAGYEGFIYSDRGVYRPGEKANVRTIVRAAGVKVPESFPVIFEVIRPDGKKFKDYNAILNQFGTADVEIELPDYALTGEYKIALKVPGSEKAIGESKINVEEFIPDSLKVTAKIADKRFKKEDTVPVEVNVQQNFGAPAAARDVDVSFNLKTVKFEPEGYKGFVFEDETKSFSYKREYLAVKKSDENGDVAFEIKTDDLKLPPSALEMSIRVTAKEIGGRGSSVYEERNVDVYPYYIGVKPQFEGNGVLGQEMKFDYVTVLPDGEKAVQVEASVDVCKLIWNSMIKKDNNGKWQWVTESREDCFDHKSLTPSDGTGVFTFVPQDAGDHVLRFKGTGDKAHSAVVKLFVSGPGVVSWAKERPDRIELSFDRGSYAVGETAQLTIKAPFSGKGLLTCATDRVFLSKAMDTSGSAQLESVPVTEDFSPNAYCSMTVIRPVVAGEQWTSHRGYGVVPIVVNNEVHKTVVEVNVPGEVRPRDVVKLNIQGPVGKQMEFSVALVDDAILRLTGYKIPDPYEFFYGKRMNGVQTSDIYSLLMPEFNEERGTADSSPSGDAGYDAKRRNPVNAKRVKSAVIWKSQIVSDVNGKASVDFTVPEFNGKLRWIVVGAGEGDFTAQAGEVKVAEPLVLNPFIPRFLAMDDEFVLPVSVSNMTREAGSVNVVLEHSEGFVVMGEKTQSVSIEPGKEGVVVFKLKAPGKPQKAQIKISASLGKESVSRSTEIAVRPPVSWTTINGVLEVPAGAVKTAALPGDWMKGTAKTKLVVSGMPSLKFSGGLGYLMKYPYGCLEQTVSSVFPLLYLRDLANVIDAQKYAPGSIEKIVNAGIERALSMQHLSGSFGMWPGIRGEYVFGSVYATDFLVEADKAGYAVPQFAKVLALGNLEKVLSRKNEEYTPEIKAYAVYVLAKAGRVNASWVRRLQEMKDKLPFESRFYTAAALGILGDRKAVEDILGQGFPDENIKRELGGSLTSYVRQNAAALSIYMDLAPQNAMVPVLVSRLEKSMNNGQWASTQENAQALIALGKYARYFSGENIGFTGTVKVGDQVREFNSREVLQVSGLDLSGKTIEVSVIGKGTAYLYWISEGVPLGAQVKEEDKGINIRRSFLDRDGKPVDLKAIKQGDTLIVALTIGSSGMENVVIEDLLPAGFEVENPRLATTEKLDSSSQEMIDPVNVDIRDDRMVLFIDTKRGTERYRYIVRAVTKGDFVLPAVKAEAMYDPSIFSVSGQGRVQVTE